jgi:hypothetical protein
MQSPTNTLNREQLDALLLGRLSAVVDEALLTSVALGGLSTERRDVH